MTPEEYRAAKAKEYQRRYYLEHREEKLAYQKRYNREHRDKIREYRRKYMGDYRSGVLRKPEEE